jgi:hypothetical protein
MVARTTHTACIIKFPSHNAEYVTQVKTEFIDVKFFLQNKINITCEAKLQSFQRINELSNRSQVKMLHADHNFSAIVIIGILPFCHQFLNISDNFYSADLRNISVSCCNSLMIVSKSGDSP